MRRFPAGVLELAVFFLLAGRLGAADLTLANGRVLRDATVTAEDADTARVRHAGGEERVYLFDLPVEEQRRLGFDPLAALRRRTAEVERLKAELAAARGEVAAKSQALVKATAPRNAALWTNLPPTRPAAELPPIGPNETVSVFDLVNHYRADPSSADARYRRKSFRLEGVVERIEDGLLTRTIKVLFESPDPAQRVVGEWFVPETLQKFYTKQEGRELWVTGGRGPNPLLQNGRKAVFEARCTGLKDGALRLDRLELVP